eukprot:g5948.t1
MKNDYSLIDHLNESLYNRNLLSMQTAKVQLNEGLGGCFPWHYDTDPLIDARRITAILYLNDGWIEQDGGQLCLNPWPEPITQIEPLEGRVVLFSSPDLVHRVLPSKKARYCITFWLWAKENNAKWRGANCHQNLFDHAVDSNESQECKEFLKSLQILLEPQFRRHFIRYVLGESWAKSLRESHGDKPETTLAITKLFKELDIIEHVLVRTLEEKQIVDCRKILSNFREDTDFVTEMIEKTGVNKNLINWFGQ